MWKAIDNVLAWIRDKSHRIKYFIFQNLWIFAPLIIATGLTWLVSPDWPVEWGGGFEWRQRLAIVGGTLTALYLLQKQKLEETQLFAELFTSFNNRYDEMNEELNKLVNKNGVLLGGSEKDLLYDYFNLCAEEYMFYQRGYIPPRVWDAWKNGMHDFMQDERVRELWKEEKKSNSYYGLEMPEPES